ncbi:MAG: carbohydrate porin [Gammaproteobacteria bacterium]|nr:carbohydrate porin [Gammaproteobacteria bacterium]
MWLENSMAFGARFFSRMIMNRVAELYYRFQLFQHMSITPDIQYLVNPALNPSEDQIWILGLRGRFSF